ncbi:hypothetical protein [Sphingomonas limnosediminicola]
MLLGPEQLIEFRVHRDIPVTGLLLSKSLAVEHHLGQRDGEDR